MSVFLSYKCGGDSGGVVTAGATSWTGWAVSSITSKFYKSGGGGGGGKTGGGSQKLPTSSVGTSAQEIGSGGRGEGEGEGKREGEDAKVEDEGWDEDEWEV